MPTRKGRIVNWNENEGVGFIAPEDGGDNIFVHCSALVGRLYNPDQVGNPRLSLSTFGLVVGSKVRCEELYDNKSGEIRADYVERLMTNKRKSAGQSSEKAEEEVKAAEKDEKKARHRERSPVLAK